jgi:hypothetical protein
LIDVPATHGTRLSAEFYKSMVGVFGHRRDHRQAETSPHSSFGYLELGGESMELGADQAGEAGKGIGMLAQGVIDE